MKIYNSGGESSRAVWNSGEVLVVTCRHVVLGLTWQLSKNAPAHASFDWFSVVRRKKEKDRAGERGRPIFQRVLRFPNGTATATPIAVIIESDGERGRGGNPSVQARAISLRSAKMLFFLLWDLKIARVQRRRRCISLFSPYLPEGDLIRKTGGIFKPVCTARVKGGKWTARARAATLWMGESRAVEETVSIYSRNAINFSALLVGCIAGACEHVVERCTRNLSSPDAHSISARCNIYHSARESIFISPIIRRSLFSSFKPLRPWGKYLYKVYAWVSLWLY